MIRYCFILMLSWLMFSCDDVPRTTVGIHVKGERVETDPVIYTKDSIYTLQLDSAGSATVTLPDHFKAGYGELGYGRARLLLYLEPGKSFDLSMSFEGKKMTPEFSGEGARTNEYLCKRHNVLPDFKVSEEEFIRMLEDQESAEFADLDTLGFGAEFVKLEKQRLHYVFFKIFPMYPSYHKYYSKLEDFKPSAVYYNYLRSLIREEESLLELEDYKTALSSFVQAYSVKDAENNNALERLRMTLDFITKNISNPAVASYLVDKFATAYVSRSGVDHLDEIAPVYNEKVISLEQKARFEEMCAEWAKIARGQSSPSFKYTDIEGNEVCLEDLAGKYVLIDVWATWCAPCRGELPALKDLEHQYKDKNICFVSISCDENKAAWEKMVKEEKLGGVQLHMAGDQEFMNAYQIRSIPRFILLDPEGKIVTSVMTRPSNPETVATLDSLEGI